MDPASRDTPFLIGVAGRCGSEEEKAYVKQAVFLLRYRMRLMPVEAVPPPAPSDRIV